MSYPTRYLVNTFTKGGRVCVDGSDLFNFLVLAGEYEASSIVIKLLKTNEAFNKIYVGEK